MCHAVAAPAEADRARRQRLERFEEPRCVRSAPFRTAATHKIQIRSMVRVRALKRALLLLVHDCYFDGLLLDQPLIGVRQCFEAFEFADGIRNNLDVIKLQFEFVLCVLCVSCVAASMRRKLRRHWRP